MNAIAALLPRPRPAAAVGLLLLGGWLVYLAQYVPALSRGDFFLAMMRVARSVEQGDLLYALTWPLHILGGHIVFYERLLQLANYYLFGFSPLFVKAAAMAAWSLLAVAVFLFIRRLPLAEGTRLACLLLFAVLTFTPLPWLVVVWADSTVPYLSSLIVLLFVAPVLVGATEDGWRATGRARVALATVLVIFGSGVGWAILPALAWLTLLHKARQGHLRRILPRLAAAAALAVAAAWLMLTFFWFELRLGVVVESLAVLPGNLGRVMAYFVSLFGTFFAATARPWNLWLGGAFLAVSLATYVAYRRRIGRASEPELLYVFGVVGLALVSLGRWKLGADRGEESPLSYYHLFALPAYYGFVAMALRLLPQRAAPRVGGAAAMALAVAFAAAAPGHHKQLLETRYLYQQMIRPLQGWRMTESTRLIGEPEINHEIYFEFLPMLKRTGRWPQLTADFHPYKSTRMAPPQATANGRSCGAYRNLELLMTEPDRRAVYGAAADLPDYRRFVGAAREPGQCEQSGMSVSLVAADGTVMCRTWTTSNVHWNYNAPQHADIAASPYAFDFTCPVEEGDYFLVAQDPAGKVFEALPVASKLAPMAPPAATGNGRTSSTYRNLEVLAVETSWCRWTPPAGCSKP